MKRVTWEKGMHQTGQVRQELEIGIYMNGEMSRSVSSALKEFQGEVWISM